MELIVKAILQIIKAITTASPIAMVTTVCIVALVCMVLFAWIVMKK